MLYIFRCYVVLLLLAAVCVCFDTSLRAAPAYSVLHTFNAYSDGYSPIGEPSFGPDGYLYGVTRYGGTNGQGAVIKLTEAGGLTTLHSFTNSGDGYYPNPSVAIDSNGNIYGTTQGSSTLWTIKPDGTNFHTLYTFQSSVYASVTLGADGYLYGTTYGDGTNGYGTIYKIKADGSQSAPTTIYNFLSSDPNYIQNSLIVSGTKIYGFSSSGAANNQGGIFSLPTAGASSLTFVSFNSSSTIYNPNSLIFGKDGDLYGSASNGGDSGDGAVFQYSPSTNQLSNVYSFHGAADGYYGQDLVQGADGYLYGSTISGGMDANGNGGDGTVFKIKTSGGTPTILHSFLSDGSEGYNGAYLTIAANKSIYLFQNYGGISGHNYGVLDKLSPGTGLAYSLSELYDFGNGYFDGTTPYYGSLVVGPDGRLHGGTSNTKYLGTSLIYGINLDGTNYSKDSLLQDGSIYGTLLYGTDGNIYATTYNGGSFSAGSIEQITPTGLDYDFWDFGATAGAYLPSGVIYGSDGWLYGVSSQGGRYNNGCIYKVDPTGSNETILYSFTGGADGNYPNGGMILASDGNFYGTCENGGVSSNSGTIWRSTQTGKITVLAMFDSVNTGQNPYSGVIEGFDGKLYGTTSYGGANNYGTVYSLTKSGSGLTVLYSFANDTNGGYPVSGVIQTPDGLLYGTTTGDATNGAGVVYSLDKTGSPAIITPIYTFGGTNNNDGYYPYASLTLAPDGNLYGTTYSGGVAPYPGTAVAGEIYKLTTQFPIINSFTPTAGVGGTTVTINGANLTGATAVSFGGGKGTIMSQSATQIVATVPTAAKTGRIVITLPGKTSTSYSLWTYLAPAISSINPTKGSGGTAITIAGANFVAPVSVTVKSAGVVTPLTNIVLVSAAKITAIYPHNVGSGPISVTTNGGSATYKTAFKVNAPTITSFSPSSGLPGTSVTVTGTNFVDVSAVTIGGITIATSGYTVTSATQIKLIVPPGAVSGTITVTTPGGKAITKTNFIVPAPTISSFSPASGSVGTSVAIIGTNFTGATSVKFTGVAASQFVVVSATQINVFVPSGASTGPISVATPAGTATSSTNFTVN